MAAILSLTSTCNELDISGTDGLTEVAVNSRDILVSNETNQMLSTNVHFLKMHFITSLRADIIYDDVCCGKHSIIDELFNL